MSANDILFTYQSSGASQTTAWSQSRKLKDGKIVGVEASRAMAKEDLARLKPFAAKFIALGKKYDVPPALLAAIASRESRGGLALDAEGWGDNGNGYGLMQVDKNAHTPEGGPFSGEHIEQATRVLRATIDGVTDKHKDWPAAQRLRGGVAAYNFGVGNVWTIAGMDEKTTGDDYSSDVWARARFLAPEFGGTGPAGAVVKAEPAAQGPSVVHDLQLLLIRHGYMTEDEVKTGPGILGPRTKAAVARFLRDKSGTTPAPTTVPKTAPKPNGTPAIPAPVAGGDGAFAPGVSIGATNPILKKLATEPLNIGETSSCVRTTLNNMKRLGITAIPFATGNDKNNSRGGMVQMLLNGQWESLPLAGSQRKTIKSPYGTVEAQVISGAEYKKLALAGRIPSGAIIFQTKHGWDYGAGASGNDMGIVRDGGKVTFNYASMPPIVYGAATKEVVLLLPKGAIVRN